jgi:hypothetical protein
MLEATISELLRPSTATTCARYFETDASHSLTTRLGTFSVRYGVGPIVFTCPDGIRFSMSDEEALGCIDDFPGWLTSHYPATGITAFRLFGAPPADDAVWRCR